MARAPIRVLICDDSLLIRQLLTAVLSSDPEIEVVGSAREPKEARQMIKDLNPDVLTLDIEMPGMDGLSFLEKIMTLRPMPVVMISSLTTKGSAQSVLALELGVVDLVAKPTKAINESLEQLRDEICGKVKSASTARVAALRPAHTQALLGQHKDGAIKVIAVGASTGGVQAVKDIFPLLTPAFPPIVFTQHMPESFTDAFAKRMNGHCMVNVIEARHQMALRPGMIAVAPGSQHLTVKQVGDRLECRLDDEPPMSGHRPSVDKLFLSVADEIGAQAVGVLLTGMGRDGAHGLLQMRRAGAHTIGQDEASSIVYGMPRVAQEVGAVAEQVTLTKIAKALEAACWPARRSPKARQTG